jgi:hypothetical protein
MTDVLDTALDNLVPVFADEHPDWRDVVARADGRRLRRSFGWRQHPRRSLAIALALALIALLATPAFGVQGYVLHLLGRKNVSFTSSRSAPNVVKKQFLDLPIGAPHQFSPQVKAAQTRVVASFTIVGHRRRLWVAPTRPGGYCYMFELSFGGCRQSRIDRSIGGKGQFGVTWSGGSLRLGVNQSIVTRVGGDITAPAAARITATYADHTSGDVSFVWVSRPIAAGFFTYDIPTAHWNRQHRLLALTLYAKSGRELGRQTFPYDPDPAKVRLPLPSQIRTPKQRVLPTAPPVPPSAPRERGSADGFQVVVGHNGAVQFTQVGQTPILRELAGRSAGYGCFRLTKEFGIFTVRGLSQEGRLASKVGFQLNGVGRPVDGCELQTSIGHVWPDRLQNRAAVEIPLTPAGRAYFADRRAARDLALFVRSRRMHLLREEPAAQARADILHAYGKQLAKSRISIEVIDGVTVRLTEPSATGRRFAVTIRGGRIKQQNLKPYAFVF